MARCNGPICPLGKKCVGKGYNLFEYDCDNPIVPKPPEPTKKESTNTRGGEVLPTAGHFDFFGKLFNEVKNAIFRPIIPEVNAKEVPKLNANGKADVGAGAGLDATGSASEIITIPPPQTPPSATCMLKDQIIPSNKTFFIVIGIAVLIVILMIVRNL